MYQSLTKEQQNALKEITDFLKCNKSDVFILTGRAGSGKSSLIPSIVENCNQLYKIMAPTGRAVKVLRDKLPNDTLYTAYKTIYQSSLGTAKGDGERLDSVRFYFPINTVTEPTVFIVDESSLISSSEQVDDILQYGTGSLLNDLLMSSGIINGMKSKIIFIGDTYQLPPVTDSESTALYAHYFTERNLKVKEFNLEGNVRQEHHSAIQRIIDNYSGVIDLPKEARRVFEILSDKKSVFEISNELVPEQYVRSGSYKNSVVICYKNSDVFSYNKKIRELLFPGKREITVGDVIVFYRNNYHTYSKEIIAGDFAKITSVDPNLITKTVDKVRIDNAGNPVFVRFQFRKVTFKFLSDPHQEEIDAYIMDSFLNISNSVLNHDEVVALYQEFNIRYQKENKLKIKALRQQNINIESDETHRKHDARTNEYVEEAKKKLVDLGISVNEKMTKREIKKLVQLNPSADPKNDCKRIAVPNDFFDQLEQDPFYNAVLAKYAYAMTCHKAQGGEWDNVFVDFSDRHGIDDDRLRWGYTAITRARKKVVLANSPSMFNKFRVSDKVQRSSFFAVTNEYQPTDHLTTGLFSVISDICLKLSIRIIKVDDSNYADWFIDYYFETDFTSKIQFYYNKKNGWTTARPAESVDNDQKLHTLIKQIRRELDK